VPLTERAMHALLQWRLGQDLDRQAWGEAYEDQGLVFARQNGAPLDAAFDQAAHKAAAHTATTAAAGATGDGFLAPVEKAKAQVRQGGPRGDRTHNPRIKSSDDTLF
jgi:hypothetical protein